MFGCLAWKASLYNELRLTWSTSFRPAFRCSCSHAQQCGQYNWPEMRHQSLNILNIYAYMQYMWDVNWYIPTGRLLSIHTLSVNAVGDTKAKSFYKFFFPVWHWYHHQFPHTSPPAHSPSPIVHGLLAHPCHQGQPVEYRPTNQPARNVITIRYWLWFIYTSKKKGKRE